MSDILNKPRKMLLNGLYLLYDDDLGDSDKLSKKGFIKKWQICLVMIIMLLVKQLYLVVQKKYISKTLNIRNSQ